MWRRPVRRKAGAVSDGGGMQEVRQEPEAEFKDVGVDAGVVSFDELRGQVGRKDWGDIPLHDHQNHLRAILDANPRFLVRLLQVSQLATPRQAFRLRGARSMC